VIETAIYLQTEGRRLARAQCESLGVTATQLNVLKLLEELGDLSLSELSRRIAAQNSTVTGIVDRMEEARLVLRERDTVDRRVWRIRATERGKKIARSAEVAPWTMLRNAALALPVKERKTLLELLGRIADHVRGQMTNQTTKEASDVGK
jgi:DNA-binding MarR family transcriptional regulator